MLGPLLVLLFKLLFVFFLAGLLCYFLRYLFLNSRLRFVFIILHGFFLTALVYLFLNDPSLVMGEQLNFMGWFKEKTKDEANASYQYVRDNFLLINTALDKQLIPNPEGSEGDSTTVIITDRQKLLRLFTVLTQNQKEVDMVVCDIDFSNKTPHDTALKKLMDEFYKKGKLLVYYDGHEPNPVLRFPYEACGDVTEHAEEGMFVSHQLVEGKVPSLSYRLYAYERNRDIKDSLLFGKILREWDGHNSHYVLNTFIPSFAMTNEKRLMNQADRVSMQGGGVTEAMTASLNYLNLGEALMDEGYFLGIALQNRKKTGLKNTVFIGAFTGEADDVHNTPYGKLHGSTIVLNVLHNLLEERHAVKIWHLLFLTFCFSLVTAMVVKEYNQAFQCWAKNIIGPYWHSVLRLLTRRRTDPQSVKKPDSQLSPASRGMDLGRLTLNYVFQKFHYFFLIGSAFLFFYLTGRFINILSLLLYFSLLDMWFTHYAKYQSRI